MHKGIGRNAFEMMGESKKLFLAKQIDNTYRIENRAKYKKSKISENKMDNCR